MEKQSFSDGLFSPLGIKRVIFMLVLLTTSFISCSNSDEKGGSLEGAKLYVSLFPCNECAKAIIQSGIKEVIYDSNKYEGTAAVMASMKMFDSAGVNYHKYHRTEREIQISL